MFKTGGPQNWWPGETPFEVMVGAILTQNTSWKNVERAIENLKKVNVLYPQKLDRIPLAKLKRWLRPSGFFNIKTRRLKAFLKFFKSRFGYSVFRMKKEKLESLREELLAVNGIGRETADSILLYALDKKVFVIDAYTRRIFSRHGLFEKEASYDAIRLWFENHLPQSKPLYNDYHAQIVRIGKDYCRKHPKCDSCPLGFLFHLPGLPQSL